MQAVGLAWEASAPSFSGMSSALRRSCPRSPHGSSSRTCPESGSSPSDKLPALFPMQGMMLGGRLFELAPLADTIAANDGSALPGSDHRLLWPTPRALPESQMLCQNFGNLLTSVFSRGFKDWHVAQRIKRDFGYVNPDWIEWLMGYPHKWTDADCAATTCWATPSALPRPSLPSEYWPGWVRIPQNPPLPSEERYPDLTSLLKSFRRTNE